jgi:tetratricopeptide (TPR) repeat protein
MKTILLSLISCFATQIALAEETPLPDSVAAIAHRWAAIYYHMPEKDRESAYQALADVAAQAVQTQPQKAEPLVWEAIVLASYAKEQGGLGTLGKVKQARDLLLTAERLDPKALNGSVYTSLGSLYAKVPGWPIGFGDKTKARGYLEAALRINPASIDAHYFYGDLLASQGAYAKAMDQLKLALKAPPRPDREDADSGRREEIQALITQIRSQHGDQL